MPERTTRRELIALAGASLLSPALPAQQRASSPILGSDITVDSRQPGAEAFALKDDRFFRRRLQSRSSS